MRLDKIPASDPSRKRKRANALQKAPSTTTPEFQPPWNAHYEDDHASSSNSSATKPQKRPRFADEHENSYLDQVDARDDGDGPVVLPGSDPAKLFNGFREVPVGDYPLGTFPHDPRQEHDSDRNSTQATDKQAFFDQTTLDGQASAGASSGPLVSTTRIRTKRRGNRTTESYGDLKKDALRDIPTDPASDAAALLSITRHRPLPRESGIPSEPSSSARFDQGNPQVRSSTPPCPRSPTLQDAINSRHLASSPPLSSRNGWTRLKVDVTSRRQLGDRTNWIHHTNELGSEGYCSTKYPRRGRKMRTLRHANHASNVVGNVGPPVSSIPPASAFLNLPFDVFEEIAEYLHPRDLLRLIRANKALRDILSYIDDPAILRIWTRAVARLDVPLANGTVLSLPRHPSLNAIQMCNALFGEWCMGCKRKCGNAHSKSMMLRYCQRCSESGTQIAFLGHLTPRYPAIRRTGLKEVLFILADEFIDGPPPPNLAFMGRKRFDRIIERWRNEPAAQIKDDLMAIRVVEKNWKDDVNVWRRRVLSERKTEILKRLKEKYPAEVLNELHRVPCWRPLSRYPPVPVDDVEWETLGPKIISGIDAYLAKSKHRIEDYPYRINAKAMSDAEYDSENEDDGPGDSASLELALDPEMPGRFKKDFLKDPVGCRFPTWVDPSEDDLLRDLES